MGFYADLEMNCRVYHNCDDHGNKFTYYCPIDTAFRQEAMVCDHSHLVKCQSVEENPPDKSQGFSSLKNSPSDRKSSGFSRSFRIGQDNVPSNSVQSKSPSFILSSSVFLRNRSDTAKKSTTFKDFRFTTKSPLDISRTTNFRKKEFSSTARPTFTGKTFTNQKFFNRDSSSDFQESTPMRNENFFKQTSFLKTTEKPKETFTRNFFINRDDVFPKSKSRPHMFLEPPLFGEGKTTSGLEFTTKSPFDFGSSNYPYMETLRSIQRESRTTERPVTMTTRRSVTTKSTVKSTTNVVTTEIPFAVLTASLKPLVPNEVEYDPYYPKFPTSTEIFYILKDPSQNIKPSKLATRKPPTDLHLRIPSVLPDLNSLEDLVDRRKFFYIPKSRSS